MANDTLDVKLQNLQNEQLEQTSSENLKYRPNKRQRSIRRTVYNRYHALRDDPLRREAEADWEIADKEYEMYIPEIDPDDWRSHLQLPDAFSAIQTQMQETIERKDRPCLNATEESDEPTEELANASLTYNMNNTDFDYQYFLAKLSASIRGTAFMMDYWRTDKRIVKDPTSVGEDGKIIYKDKELLDFDDDYTEWIPNEFVYVDEKAKHINEAIDGIRREVLHINEFHRIYGSKNGFYDTEYVQTGGDTSNRSFFQLPKDMSEQDVEVLHYYNRSIDAYWVVANNITVYDEPLPWKHKELPFAVVYQYRTPGRFWGVGIPKIVHFLSEERKTIRNLNIDRQKLIIGGTFLHNSAFDIDDEDTQLEPGRMINVETNGQPVDQAIKQLQMGDTPASAFKSEEILLEDMRRVTGIDDRIVVSNQGTTATQAAMVKESSLKRINLISQLTEMDTILRIGRLKWSNIQFFYPVPRFEKIFENNKERDEKVYRKITVQGKKFSIVDDEGNKKLKLDEIRGSSALRLDKSMAKYLEGSFDLSVGSEVFIPPSKALHQTQFTQTLSLLLANPLTASVLDPIKIVTQAAKLADQKPETWLKGEGVSIEDMRLLADSENMIMASGQPIAPTENATEEHTLVHLTYTNSVEFQNLLPENQELISDHLMGENEANPNTGSSADLMGRPQPLGGNQNLMGEPGPSLNPNTTESQAQVADLQNANFQQ